MSKEEEEKEDRAYLDALKRSFGEMPETDGDPIMTLPNGKPFPTHVERNVFLCDVMVAVRSGSHVDIVAMTDEEYKEMKDYEKRRNE